MLKKILSISFLGLFSFSSTAFAATDCQNDPRLYVIGSIINQIKDGKEIKPIKMNASTFLNLTTPVRDALGDNIQVYNDQCIPSQVYDQKLPSKINVPFEELLLAIEWAFIRNDTKTVQSLINQFKPTSKTTAELISMMGAVSWSDKTQDAAFKFNWLKPAGSLHEGVRVNQAKCFEHRATPSLIELYAKLGGTASDNVLISYDSTSSSYSSNYLLLSTENQYQSTYNGEFMNVKPGELCTITNANNVLSALQATGIRMTKNGGGSGYNNMKSWIDKAFPDYQEKNQNQN